MRVLVMCEESQAVCEAFRERGHEAYSVDLQECSGGHPEWHYIGDCFEVMENEGPFDLIIAFPPCTYLTKVGAPHWNKPGRPEKQFDALVFVHKIMDLDVPRIAIENPVGAISTRIRKPDQKIQPYHFGHPWKKETCLWLKGLPPLRATNIVTPTGFWVNGGGGRTGRISMHTGSREGAMHNQKLRSKTFLGIAKAMAEQWG